MNMVDQFRIQMLYPSTSGARKREWYSQWHLGAQRSFSFGPAGSSDPELIFRGSGKYTIYGASGSQNGQMRVTGSCPRIYVRASAVESERLPVETPTWSNVEVTFYVITTDPGQSVSYAGIEAVARTNHYPDDAICSTRGYGGKINWDGRVHCEKECGHNIGNKQTPNTYPFGKGVKMPINKWIGYKFITRSCEGGSKCLLEIWMDLTNGLNGGKWAKVHEFIDYDGWSSSQGAKPPVTPLPPLPHCCSTHTGKVLGENYSMYLRTDGLGEQFYRQLSVREIDPLL